jgi:hypothetical protein
MGKGHGPIDKGQICELMADEVVSTARGAVQFDWTRAGHIFREAPGHVYPTTAASRERYTRLFEHVASNPAHRRLNAPLPRAAVAAGVEVYVQTQRNGKQIWVYVRDRRILNAGVNPVGEQS